jgi:hypothetical protein
MHFWLRLCHTFSRHEHAEDRVFLNITDCFFMRHHREIITIALENFVMNTKAGFASCTVVINFRHIDALKIDGSVVKITKIGYQQ